MRRGKGTREEREETREQFRVLVAVLRGGTEYAWSPVVRILRTEPNVEEDWPPNVEARITIAHPKND